ncbi:MAG: FtsH protease activity modulator HflK, partial [Plesiomonas sp.]
RFNKLLPEYQTAPQVTRERMYLDTMEKVLGNSNKILVDTNGNNLLMLPTDQMLKNNADATTAAAAAAAAVTTLPSVNDVGRNSGNYQTSTDGQNSRVDNGLDRQGRF